MSTEPANGPYLSFGVASVDCREIFVQIHGRIHSTILYKKVIQIFKNRKPVARRHIVAAIAQSPYTGVVRTPHCDRAENARLSVDMLLKTNRTAIVESWYIRTALAQSSHGCRAVPVQYP